MRIRIILVSRQILPALIMPLRKEVNHGNESGVLDCEALLVCLLISRRVAQSEAQHKSANKIATKLRNHKPLVPDHMLALNHYCHMVDSLIFVILKLHIPEWIVMEPISMSILVVAAKL